MERRSSILVPSHESVQHIQVPEEYRSLSRLAKVFTAFKDTVLPANYDRIEALRILFDKKHVERGDFEFDHHYWFGKAITFQNIGWTRTIIKLPNDGTIYPAAAALGLDGSPHQWHNSFGWLLLKDEHLSTYLRPIVDFAWNFFKIDLATDERMTVNAHYHDQADRLDLTFDHYNQTTGVILHQLTFKFEPDHPVARQVSDRWKERSLIIHNGKLCIKHVDGSLYELPEQETKEEK